MPDEDEEEFTVDSLSLVLSSEAVDELSALEAIYDSRLSLRDSSFSNALQSRGGTSHQVVHLLLPTQLPSFPEDDISLILSVSSKYPFDAAPQLQLANSFLSSFSVPDDLFADVLRTYMHENGQGVAWNQTECLYDGIEWVRQRCDNWVKSKKAHIEQADIRLQQEKQQTHAQSHEEPEPVTSVVDREQTEKRVATSDCPPVFSCEPLVDRKSVFVGHVARVHSQDDIKAVMDSLLSNSKIARATHNIQAYRFLRDGRQIADNDDDGESAAGSRLAQLLELLDVQDVLVVVSRWYGGIHLGPDRFKLINSAARSALEGAGLLNDPASDNKKGKKK